MTYRRCGLMSESGAAFVRSLPEALDLSRLRILRIFPCKACLIKVLPRPNSINAKRRISPNRDTAVRHLSTPLDISDRISSRNCVSESTEDQQIEHDNASLAALPGFMRMNSLETADPQLALESYGDGTEGRRRNYKRIREVEAEDFDINIQRPDSSVDPHSLGSKNTREKRRAKRRKAPLAIGPTQSLTSARGHGPASHDAENESTGSMKSETDDIGTPGGGMQHSTLIDNQRLSDSVEPSVAPSAVIPTDMEWGFCDISGMEQDDDGEEHFWVKWDDTLMPRSALKNADELIAKFKARCPEKLKLKTSSTGPSQVQGGLGRPEDGMLGKDRHEKRRGRPRKQV
jgi:hypothetical protein